MIEIGKHKNDSLGLCVRELLFYWTAFKGFVTSVEGTKM